MMHGHGYKGSSWVACMFLLTNSYNYELSMVVWYRSVMTALCKAETEDMD